MEIQWHKVGRMQGNWVCLDANAQIVQMHNVSLANHVQCMVNAFKTNLAQNQWTQTARRQRYAHFNAVYNQCSD